MASERTAARRGPRGPYAKSERTRKAILDAALEVFAQSGYRSGSLRDVAERVGMSEAGLLHHFPSKRALFWQMLTRREEQTREQLAFDPSDGWSVLRDLVRLTEHNSQVPGVVELFCILSAESTRPSHPAHQYFIDRYEANRRTIAAAFSVLHARGELRPGVDPESAARGVIALMDGLQIQWLLDRSSVDMAAEVRRYLSSLVDGEI